MAFYKVTYNSRHHFATVHNYGCTFRCPICSYKLVSGPGGTPGLAYPKPEKYLTNEEIKDALRSVSPGRVNFMGGEPTVAKALPDILDFAKNKLGAKTSLGHTNGSDLNIANLDAANVGLKAWDEDVHKFITGVDKKKIYDSFEKAARRGMELSANLILIPGLVDVDQVEAVAGYISSFENVRFHIMGYIPVPGQPYRRPTVDEMRDAQATARKYIRDVEYSHLTPEQVLSLERDDDRFDVKVIAGCGSARMIVPSASKASGTGS
ncbi:MAG: radical SAM protein [Methanomassiliicoccaceae archaeon]|jgi:pyruvate formate lyase activating enzyme|nr:radical SAM protein [Methanomassiliicoccaceae archaeon]